MCKCTPNIRTPFCGKSGCEWPKPKQLHPDGIPSKLSGRVDLDKYLRKSAKLKNFKLQAHSGVKKRKGFKLLTSVPDGESIVSMATFKDEIYVATCNAVYKLIDEQLVPIGDS